ncbi:MAG: hypothetical protein WC675_05635 [Patescibacteria group bacterium]|jgi:hypothetical protein
MTNDQKQKINNLISKLNADLSDINFFKKTQEELTDLIVQNSAEQAYYLAIFLDYFLKQRKNFEKDYPQLYRDYQTIISKAKWVCLPLLSLQEVIGLFEENLAEALLDPDIVVWEKLRAFLVAHILLDERDNIKRELRATLLRNNQILTQGDIIAENQSHSGTISNWLRDYNQKLGAAKLESKNIELYQYITNDSNIKKLNPEERRCLISLFTLYERLKASSSEVAGYEGSLGISDEGEGKFAIISDGEVVSLDKRSEKMIEQAQDIIDVALGKKPASILKKSKVVESPIQSVDNEPPKQTLIEKEILAAYQGDQKQQQAIAKEEAKITKSFGTDLMKIRQEFFLAVQNKNVSRTIATLNILTKQNDLENFVKTDTKLSQFLTAIWEKRYGKEFTAEFKQKPGQLKFVRLFLRYVLEERLGLSVSEAARVGLQLGNIFVSLGQKDYNKMAYFDVEAKAFNWFED